MSESAVVEGRVRSERHGHILKIVIDNPAKKNAFVPQMMAQLSAAMTELDRDPELWVGVLCAEGDNFTAGLDMPKFFGPTATPSQIPDDHIDPFGMRNQCRKPLVTAVQGICFTVGIEMALAGDIVVAAEGTPLLPDGGQARHRPAGRRPLPLHHPRRLGQRDVPPDAVRRVRGRGGLPHRAGAGGHARRPAGRARHGDRRASSPPTPRSASRSPRRPAASSSRPASARPSTPSRPSAQRVMGTADAAEGIASFVERRAAVFQGR